MKLSRAFECKKVLWTSIVVMLLASVTMVTVSSASPDKKLYLSPAVVAPSNIWTGDPDGPGPLPYASYLPTIYIMVEEAPNTYAWELSVSWDPDLLELLLIEELEFLHRSEYATAFLYHPDLTDANAAGEIKVGCSLVGEVPWANATNSPTGRLAKLGFIVDGGATPAQGSCVIDLFNTVLFDHIVGGSPASTPYDNQNCFFYNVATHDIGVTSVTAPSRVQIGYPAIVSVTVVNEGTSTETFDIDLYDGATLIGSTPVANLAGFGTFTTKTFSLSTATAHVYNLVASVNPVTGETDTTDNTLIDGTVSVEPPDIAVVSVVPLIPELHGTKGPFYGYLPSPPYPPGIGYTLTTVTVKNEGPGYSGPFTIIVYAQNSTGHWKAVSSYAVANLPPGVQTSIPIGPWVIYGAKPDTYLLNATLTPVTGEVDRADNSLKQGAVIVTYAIGPSFVDWELKVNHASGTGIGHKSTVNAENLLEARAGKTAQVLVVRAMFEIKNPAGIVINRIWSSPALVPAGQNVTLPEATYVGPPSPGLYYFTAYLYYGTQYPLIRSGDISITLTLRVDVKPQG